MKFDNLIRMILKTLGPGLLLVSGGAYGCTPITSVPIAITASGVYCLTGNLTIGSGQAITVIAPAVVIDFGGYRLRAGSDPYVGNAVSIDQVDNVTIRNGFITGFSLGISSTGRATIVEDMRLSNLDLGIFITGSDPVIRRNFCRLNTQCIQVGGGSARVVDNDIAGENNGSGGGIDVAGDNALVEGNRLTRLTHGIHFFGGGKYRDNLTSNVGTPYSGGAFNAGNNN